MGMTIDEHISQLKKLKSFHNGSYGTSINFAIATMHKYQKIEQILKSLDDGEINYPQMTYYLREVLEDGNNYI